MRFLIFLALLSCSLSSKKSDKNTIVLETSKKNKHKFGERREHDQDFLYYQVRKGDTLMYLSQEIFGSPYCYKIFKNENGSKINNGHIFKEQFIKFPISKQISTPDESSLLPYKIKWGDTLGKISMSIYQDKSYWKELWSLNRKAIPNPNKIFAGVIIYYKKAHIIDVGSI